MSDIDNYDESDDVEQVPLFLRLLHWPLAIVHIVFDFVLQYLVLRPWMFLPSAVPALLAATIALAIGTWIFLQPDATVVARIEGQLPNTRST